MRQHVLSRPFVDCKSGLPDPSRVTSSSRSESYPTRWLCRRFRLRPCVALIVAEAIGLGSRP